MAQPETLYNRVKILSVLLCPSHRASYKRVPSGTAGDVDEINCTRRETELEGVGGGGGGGACLSSVHSG